MDAAHLITDEKLETMEKHLKRMYERAQREIGEKWKEYLKESGEEIKALQAEYEQAKKSGDKEEIRKTGRKLARAKRERTLLDRRFKALTEITARQLANVNQTALAYINGELPAVYAINYNEFEKEIENFGGYSFALTDADTVKYLATTDDSLLPYKELDVDEDVRWNVKKMNSEVLQGILQGDPMDVIANRLKNVTTMNEVSAIRNARTMVTGAENKGRQDSYIRAEADGIEMVRRWIATLDDRTRHWHIELHGKETKTDQPWENSIGPIMFPGDPSADGANVYNCRCAMRAVVTGFRRER